MMKVLIINTVRFDINGISTVIMNYYKALADQGVMMELVAIDKPCSEYIDLFDELGVKYYVTKKSNPVKYFFDIIRIAKKGNYNIAHIHGNSASMALELLSCFCAGIKVRIAHAHNTSTSHPILHMLLYPLFTILCTCRFACGKKAGYWLYRNREFVEINNCIDLHKYRYNSDVRMRYRKKIDAKNKLVIGHVGNFVEQKNHVFLIECFSELLKYNRNCLLLLIGDGILIESIKNKVNDLGIGKSVIFVGKTVEVESYLQAMDIFVLPSLHEGLPIVVIEAQANGLPCIVADTVSKEINFSKEVVFVPILNCSDWVSAILEKRLAVSREEQSNKWQEQIAVAGYDINANSFKLKQLYLNYCKELSDK